MSWNKSKPFKDSGQKLGGKTEVFSEAGEQKLCHQNKALKINCESLDHMAGSDLEKDCSLFSEESKAVGNKSTPPTALWRAATSST